MRPRSASTVVSSRLRGGSHVPRLSFSYHEHVVTDFLLMPHTPGVGISSPVWLLADGSSWQMTIFLSGITERHEGFVSVQLECLSFGPLTDGDGVQAKFSVSVLGPKQPLLEQPRAKLTVVSPSALTFCDGEGGRKTWEVENFIRESELKATYVDADAVTFAVEIEVLGPPSVIAQSALAPVVGPVPTLADDLAALFREVPTAPGASVVINNFSDITVVFTTPANAVKKFRAHRALLAARSPVFRRKLLSKSVNAKLFFNGNHYYLQEADVGVCEAFMVFLYTDDIRNDVLSNSAHEVLKIAARFQVERLVQIAEDYVGESLTPSTVVAALTLAADLKLERLKACCCDFVAQHAQAVRASHTLHALSAATLKELLDRDVFPAGGLHTASVPTSPAAAADVVRAEKDKDKVKELGDVTLSPLQQAQGGEGKEDAEEEGDKDSIPPAAAPATVLEDTLRTISGKQ